MGRTVRGTVGAGDGRAILGRRAEQRAFRYLCRHGLKPVARNYRTRHGEVDLVMLDEGCLVFVEVRARGSRSFVDARLTVDRHKQRKLVRAAMMFLARHRAFRHHPCRFDVIGVDRDAGGNATLTWVRDAFRVDDQGL